MDYSKLSDFEINKAVAELQPYTCVIGDGKYPSMSDDEVYVEQRIFKYGNILECGVDYCNNPSDAWPIIVENKISITSTSEKERPWCAYLWEDDCESWGVNPLRQCMIVYLMLKEGDNA